jgi:hypothetical protein
MATITDNLVRYGDHQPSATRDLINDVWGEDVGANGSPGPFCSMPWRGTIFLCGHCRNTTRSMSLISGR